jgi:hypothetical protein
MDNKADGILKQHDPPSGTELMTLSGPAAELVLNALPFQTQLACVLQVPWKDRMNVIMQSEAARELIQALPAEEVFWMVKERGIEDSLPVIARTTHEQFQYLIDLDCWQRDKFMPENCLSWYRVLGRCNIAKVLEWFEQADESLLVAGLKQFVSIHKIEEESDYSEEYEAMPPCTLDGINYFRFISEEAQLVLLPLFKVLLNNEAALFQTLIEGIIWDSRIEAEEDALHWRQSRSAENGFPLFGEALGIYQPLDTHETQKFMAAARHDTSHLMPPGGELQVRYALAEDRLPVFLRSVLPGLDAEQLERFEQLLITTANKVMVADCREVRDLDDVRQALRKTAGLVSIGLEHLSSGDLCVAQALAAQQHPELLFRCGYSLVNEIVARVRQHAGVIWTADMPRFMGFYGTPVADTALGLVRSRPLLYEGLVAQHSSLYRDFESLADVKEAASAIERLIAADRLLFECADLNLSELDALYVSSKAVSERFDVTMPALLATLLISHSLHADTRLPLLEPADLTVFVGRLREITGDDTAGALDHFAEQALVWLESDIARNTLDRQVLKTLVRDCLSPLHEMLETRAQSGTEVRYVTAVLVKQA